MARVATLLLLAARVSAADDWTFKKSEGGLALEERSVPGSPFREYRVIAELDVDPAWAAEEVWSAQRAGEVEDLKQRRVLRDEPDRLVFYDQIRTAMVSDRDYVLEVTRRRDAGRTEIRLQSIDDPLAPPAKGFVRMGSVRAGWKVEPGAQGGTRLTLWAYSEPGGALPAFLVRGPQGNRTLADMKRMLLRLRNLRVSSSR